MGFARRAAAGLAAWLEDRAGLFRLAQTTIKAIRKPVPRRLPRALWPGKYFAASAWFTTTTRSPPSTSVRSSSRPSFKEMPMARK